MKYILVGNPNCGKTTLFNQLTKQNLHTGNYPEQIAAIQTAPRVDNPNDFITDTIGIYSLSDQINGQNPTKNCLLKSELDCIINVIDANHIENSLFLSLQLQELKIPLVIALNMMDNPTAGDNIIDTRAMADMLEIPIVPISAAKGINLEQMMAEARKAAESGKKQLQNETTPNIAEYQSKWQFIENICKNTIKSNPDKYAQSLSRKIDGIVLNQYLALPIFLFIMLLIFWLSFSIIGTPLSNIITAGFDILRVFLVKLFTEYGLNPIIQSLIVDGALAGIGIVLSFVPIVTSLFFFLTLLEDTGYMQRAAFIMDSLLQKIGLSGYSFISLIMGFGCSVPAILTTRTLPNPRDKFVTILLIPFMSCSAKLTVYAVFITAFFENHRALIMLSLYLLGILMAIIIGIITKNILIYDKTSDFIMELPCYKMPSLKSALKIIKEKSADYVSQVFSVIFTASVTICFLQNFDIHFNITEDETASILALMGQTIAPIFSPLGFGNWQAVTALISGCISKETIVSSFAVMMETGTTGLTNSLTQLFSPVTAYSFLTFTLLYTPCVATIATIRKELDSPWATLGIIVFQLAIAWLTTYVVHTILNVIF